MRLNSNSTTFCHFHLLDVDRDRALSFSCFHATFKPASNDLGVYVNKFGKTSVVWRYILQSIGPSGIALNY